METGRISWKNFIHYLIFSCAFLIYKPEVWIAFLQTLSLSGAGREKKKIRENEQLWQKTD